MIDARTVLDNVRARIPSGARLLVAYIDDNGILRLAQANCAQKDVEQIADSVKVAIWSERVGLKG